MNSISTHNSKYDLDLLFYISSSDNVTMKNLIEHKLFVLSFSILFYLSLTSCVSSVKNRTDGESRTPANEKTFAGPVDFGITFTPVTDEVAKEFWSIFFKRDSFTLGIRKSDLQGSALHRENYVNKIVTIAMTEYVSRLPSWVKSICAAPDMDAYIKGQVKYTEATKKLPKEYFWMDTPSNDMLNSKFKNLQEFWTEQKQKPDSPWGSVYKCQFEKVHGYSRKEESPQLLDSEKIASDDWKLVSDPRRIFVTQPYGATEENPVLKGYVGLSAKNYRTDEIWYGTVGGSFSEESMTEGADGPTGSPVAIGFQVIDSYLIPTSSYAISKGFPVPIAQFDRNTGKILAFYDFGLLLLHGFPKNKSVILTTVASEEKVKNYIATKDMTRFGSRGPTNFPLNSYVPFNKLPLTTPYLNYDRIPVGSIHFMANAAWSDANAASNNNALMTRIDRDELINLYIVGGAWINTYDHLLELKYKNNAPSTIEKIADGGYDELLLPSNIPEDMWISHEIILGGVKGRRILEKREAIIPVLEGRAIIGK